MDVIEKSKLLKELGMDEIAGKLLKKKKGKDKLLKAFELQYKYATEDEINEFRKEMKTYNKELKIVIIKDYDKLPPDHVIESLKKAKEQNCFDTFYVAYLQAVKDPILFGKIDDFPTLYFFIDQWGDDIKIEDIIGVD